MYSSLRVFLNRHSINVPPDIIHQYYRQNPYYPGLKAVSDILDIVGVEYQSLLLSFDNMNELGGEYLISPNKKDLVWITSVSDDHFVYMDRWGFAHSKEISEDSRNAEYVALRVADCVDFKRISLGLLFQQFRRELFAFIFLLLIICFCPQELLPVSIFSYCGSLFCFLLMQKAVSGNDVTDFICRIGNKDGCAVVAKYAKEKLGAFNVLPELGAAYFNSTIIISFFYSDISLSVFSPFICLSAILAFVLLSVQAFIIKQWCRLCCLVSLILLSEAVFQIIAVKPFEIDTQFCICFIILFVTVFAIVYAISCCVTKSMEKNEVVKEKNKIKYDPKVIESFLTSSASSFDGIGLSWEANTMAHQLTLLIGLHCGYCQQALSMISRFHHLFKKISLRIVFISEDKTKDDGCKILTLESIHTGDPIEISHLYKTFICVMRGDCIESELNSIAVNKNEKRPSFRPEHLPTIYIDGRQLSTKYSYKDLPWLALSLQLI